MKTHTITTYDFDELSEDAKEKAVEHFQSLDGIYVWGEDNVESLKGFARWINGKHDYSISLWGDSWAKVKVEGDYEIEISENEFEMLDCADMRGEDLLNFLKEKHYFQNKYSDGWFTLENSSCPFTGYCGDEDLLDPMREYIKNPDSETTLQELVNKCCERWVKSYVQDWEFAYSEEGIIELIEANEYQFTENGELY